MLTDEMPYYAAGLAVFAYSNKILFKDKNTKHNGNSTYNPSKYKSDCSEQ